MSYIHLPISPYHSVHVSLATSLFVKMEVGEQPRNETGTKGAKGMEAGGAEKYRDVSKITGME